MSWLKRRCKTKLKKDKRPAGKRQTIYGACRSAFKDRSYRDFHQERVVEADFSSELEWAVARDDNLVLEHMEKQAVNRQDIRTFPGLMADTFTSLFQRDVKIVEPEQPEFLLNQQVIQQMVDLPKYEEARLLTIGKTVPSALFSQVLDEWAIEYIEEQREKVDEHDKQNEERKEEGKEPLPDPPGFIQEQEMKVSIGKAMEKATDACKAVAELETVFGTGEGGGLLGPGWGDGESSMTRVSAKERIKLAQKFMQSRKFMEIVEMAGRLTRLWTRMDFDRCHGLEEIVDTTLGNDIERVLPTELARLGYDQAGFFADFADRKLVQTEMEGREPMGKGPVILLLDQSGSMRGKRDETSKAIAFAIMTVCRKEKRDFCYLPFATHPGGMRVYPKGRITLEEATGLIEQFLGGGTRYEAPFDKAIDQVRNSDVFDKADILMISDGVCRISTSKIASIQQAQQELGFKVTFMAVGISGADPANPPATSLDEIAESVVFCDNLGEAKVRDTVHKMLRKDN